MYRLLPPCQVFDSIFRINIVLCRCELFHVTSIRKRVGDVFTRERLTPGCLRYVKWLIIFSCHLKLKISCFAEQNLRGIPLGHFHFPTRSLRRRKSLKQLSAGRYVRSFYYKGRERQSYGVNWRFAYFFLHLIRSRTFCYCWDVPPFEPPNRTKAIISILFCTPVLPCTRCHNCGVKDIP